MRITVTPEHFAKGRKEYDNSHKLTETCALTQALKEVFPFAKVSTGLASAHLNEHREYWTGLFSVQEVNFSLDEAGKDVVYRFDNDLDLVKPVEVELFWEPNGFDEEWLIDQLVEDMRD